MLLQVLGDVDRLGGQLASAKDLDLLLVDGVCTGRREALVSGLQQPFDQMALVFFNYFDYPPALEPVQVAEGLGDLA